LACKPKKGRHLQRAAPVNPAVQKALKKPRSGLFLVRMKPNFIDEHTPKLNQELEEAAGVL
jgi:hypothetical protein